MIFVWSQFDLNLSLVLWSHELPIYHNCKTTFELINIARQLHCKELDKVNAMEYFIRLVKGTPYGFQHSLPQSNCPVSLSKARFNVGQF